MLLRPADTLDDFYKTLSPEPLLKYEELDAFYRSDINEVRGGDKVSHMALGLRRAHGAAHYKAFLMGHPGVGKSTEMTRLERQIKQQYRVIRFSAVGSLDPGSFMPFDILLVMMMLIVEETSKPVDRGGAGQAPSDASLKRILEWFATEKVSQVQETTTAIQGEAGIGPPAGSLWQKVIGLFASVKGEVKYATDRKSEIVEKRLKRISTLIDLLNILLDECNAILRDRTGCEWLFVGEDFDKPGIPVKLTEGLFLEHANIFKDLRSHLIFTIPIGLVYSERAPQLAFPSDRIHCVPDTPVFRQDHTPNTEGRAALQSILAARVRLELFEDDLKDRLIVASGGNLRDLFALVSQSADEAILRGSKTIGPSDANRAILALKTEYERRLGQSPYDAAKLTYEQKAQRLLDIYQGKPEAKIPDPVLYSLLNARAVQEFNGERWFGVHPLVVDILEHQGRLESGVAGGTRH